MWFPGSNLFHHGSVGFWHDGGDFDFRDSRVPGGHRCATNQVRHNLNSRRFEDDLLPWCEQRGMPVMGYSPLGGDSLVHDPTLARIGAAHNCSATVGSAGLGHPQWQSYRHSRIWYRCSCHACRSIIERTGPTAAEARSSAPDAGSPVGRICSGHEQCFRSRT